MCTLTYIPIKNDHFIITSNRDESPLRKRALLPQIYKVNNKKIIFPKDPVGGGSWIIASESGLIACLLNGAYAPHLPKNNYRKSRGVIVLELFSKDDLFEYLKEIDLINIEPFTLVLIHYKLILELKWNGITKNFKYYDNKLPHIWASEQLYSEENILKRKIWFKKFLSENKNLIKSDIIFFHENAGEGDMENDMKINRENTVSTLSITSVEVKGIKINLYYKDLLTTQVTNIGIASKTIREE